MKRLNVLLAAALAFTGAASAQVSGYGHGQHQPGYGQQQPGSYSQRGFTPPGAANLSQLSGTWNYTIPNGRGAEAFQAQVDATGRFVARSSTTMIQGQFNGMSGQGVAMSSGGNNGRPMQDGVQLRFDGQCHIQVTLIGQNGRPFAQGMVHVNHGPGEPCPN